MDSKMIGSGWDRLSAALRSRAGLTLVAVFVVASIGVAVVGAVYYDSQRAAIIAQKDSELSAIRDLKIDQVLQWHGALLADASQAAGDPTTHDEIAAWLANPGDASSSEVLRAWMDDIARQRQYPSAVILFADGSHWITTTGGTGPVARDLSETVAAERSDEATVTDLFLRSPGKPQLDVIAPLTLGGTKVRAVLILHGDPKRVLYPLIRQWPTPSASSETLLIRPENGGVLFLNDLRFRAGVALVMSLPAGEEKLLAVQALTGPARAVEGVDYRGVPVLGAVGPVPGTPWYIVAKTDQSEAYASILATQQLTLGAVALLLTLVALGVGLAWRQRAALLYRVGLEAERVRRQAAEQYDYLTRYANDPVVLASGNLRILQVNDAASAAYGYTRQEFLEMPLADLYDPSILEEAVVDAERVWSEQSSVFVTRHRRKDGTLFDVEISARLIEDGEDTTYLSVVRDITERRQADEALRRGAEDLKQAQALGRIGSWGFDVESSEVTWSDETFVIYGRDPAWGPPSSDQEAAYYSREQADTLHEYARRAIEGGEGSDYDLIAALPDGRRVHLSATMRAIKDASGRVVRLVGTLQDITERKMIEETLRRSEQNLNLSVGRVGTWNWDLVTDELEWSPRAKAMFGLPEDAAVTHDSFLAALHPDDRDGADAAIKEALSGKTDCDMEYRVVFPDGTVRWIYDLGRAYEDATGTPVRMAGSMLDITDRKLAEEKTRSLVADLARSNSELERFAYVASHDLQEPLRMVASYTQLLQSRYKGRLDSDADEFIEYAVDGATRMRTLINELLAYSRVGTQGAPIVPTGLEPVLVTVLKVLEQTLSESGAVVTHDSMPTVRCDGLQIGRVFQNLITNAAKFHGDEPPRIHVGAARSGGDWVFSVKDNGIGIEPAYFDRIFVIFQRLESRADYEGTGMGLAICKRIVERHGGRIWVESQRGAGSTFYFALRDDAEGFE